MNSTETTDINISFSDEWNKVKLQIFKFCSRQALNGRQISKDDAKEICQIIAIKAFKGYSNWKKNSSFRTWVYCITNNVISDYFNSITKLRYLGFDEAGRNAKFEIHDNFSNENWESEDLLKNLLTGILKIKWPKTNKSFIDELDLSIIRTKLNNPELSSVELAKYLGISVTNFDGRYCRILIEIRVFCFLNRPDLFGGISKIEKRLNYLTLKIPPIISSLEEMVFKSYVITKDYKTRPTGWQDILRSACGKMIFK